MLTGQSAIWPSFASLADFFEVRRVLKLTMQDRLQVLITNTSLANRSGSGLFVNDVARELLRRGHTPNCYSPRLGKLADELKANGITAVSNLNLVRPNFFMVVSTEF